ncbi:PspC domain-containing protein [Pleionea sp. CnH1-48]|uniref:PspC domain-containing protein n=1 Tax=Pleionea sp. CnH1-48 TaxID=2954494 RepID=UPI002097862D|nr:PspC domain-containing protein [Pleionea sp. CnH1-48]MCO7226436.1 PspC domain-containing protein [Pleionea sp. CnH1-48]
MRSHYSRSHRFYRPSNRKKVAGVCAGIALHQGWDVSLVRIAMVVSLIFFTTPTLVGYIITGLITDSI